MYRKSDRSGRMDFALAALYDQLKRPKDAADAYKAALQQDPNEHRCRTWPGGCACGLGPDGSGKQGELADSQNGPARSRKR